MFWADRIAEKIEKQYSSKIKTGKPLIIRDEKTPSGRVHVGSMRGVAIHGVIGEILAERGVKNEFLWEFNDMDPMDGLPIYLDKEKFGAYMGTPLLRVPSPDLPVVPAMPAHAGHAGQAGGKAKNFAEYFAQEFKDVIVGSGFTPRFYNVSELYLSGKMDEPIREALDRAENIRRIYREVSGSEKPADWFPLSVICEKCGKVGTTKVYAWDGEKISYRCEPEFVEWARGCSHEGMISPFRGNAKLPFKVEWPAKWKVLGVDIEGAGKDHMTKGGAHNVAKAIAGEVFKVRVPYEFAYEFFLVKGGKMSSSKGKGSSAKEIAELIPPHIFRLALLGKDHRQAVNFEPDGETIPTLYDQYDKLAAGYFRGEKDDYARLFELIHAPHERKALKERYLPRFSTVSFIVQMPHLKLEEEIERMKGSELTPEDRKELEERATYAKKWLAEHAPEKYVYELQKEAVPEAAKAFSAAQKAALGAVLEYLTKNEGAPGEDIHAKLHEIKATASIPPSEFFKAIYLAFLGKESGPKAGWFLSVLDREYLLTRLREVAG